MLATVIVPVAPHHEALSQRAVDSVNAQTVRCEPVVIVDHDRRGPGWARNRGVEQVTTPFVVFLDADDWLEPTFVETCLRYYQRGQYVYTDWLRDGKTMVTPDCVEWKTGRWHTVTTLFPTELFRALGGFDETLTAIEDTAFYMRCNSLGICGVRAPFPLMNYSGDGLRSEEFHNRKDRHEYQKVLNSRYTMGCNCMKPSHPAPNLGEKQTGDVLALTLYPPRKEFGIASARVYQRPLYSGQEMWVDPRDVAASPDLWRLKFDPAAVAPDVDTVLELAGLNV